MIQIIVVMCIIMFFLAVVCSLQQRMINNAFTAIEIQQDINRKFNSMILQVADILQKEINNGKNV